MTEARLEHVNITVPDPERTAALLIALFGWRQRWRGVQSDGRVAIHVGGADSYLSLYAPAPGQPPRPAEYGRLLNHIGIIVDDLEAAERNVTGAGLETFGHGTYEPGRRFYFFDPDGVEFEVVSYAGV
jgi:catechol 2,3-dioxygenase-like lactoylglutathione lyase family enzyme